MNYDETIIKKGIKLHTINNDKFKTNLIAVMLTTKLEKNTVTKKCVNTCYFKEGN